MSNTMLEGKVAIVTGAGRGIGRSHALCLARHGAAVLVNDLGSSITGTGAEAGPAEAVTQEIVAAGGMALADMTDIADWASARLLVERTLAAFGRIDILVNNAGITQYGSIETETAEGWHRTLAVNLTGSAAMMHWAARRWAAEGPAAGRAIINTASPAGTNPPPGATSYCVSKAGVIALTVATATELAHLGVRVNALAPMARTRMTQAVPKLDDIMRPPKRGADRMAPENVSTVMLYLASPACRFTGRIFGVDGDDVYLFNGMSAEHHLSNGGEIWDQGRLSEALMAFDPQDHGFMIAPSLHVRGATPSQKVLDVFAQIERGKPVTPLWAPLT